MSVRDAKYQRRIERLRREIYKGLKAGVTAEVIAGIVTAEKASFVDGRKLKSTKLDSEGRKKLIRDLTGSPRDYCDLCGNVVGQHNLSGWDEDGHVYCTRHGPLATKMYEST